MEKASFIRVKFTFGAKCKLAKLDRKIETNLSSMENLRTLIFKHFPEMEEMLQERPPRPTGAVAAPSRHLTVKCKDTAGDYIILENEDDLDAMELSQYNNLEFLVEITPMPSSAAHTASKFDRSAGAFPNNCSTSDKSPAYDDSFRKPRPCWNFQTGYCRFGESCRYSHDPAQRRDHIPPPRNTPTESVNNPATIEPKQLTSPTIPSPSNAGGPPASSAPRMGFQQRNKWPALMRHDRDYTNWLSRQAPRGTTMNIEYLSGEEGLPILFNFVKRRNLPDEDITLLVKLLARAELRTSLLRQKTNKIYGALMGSPFLLQLKDHIVGHLGMIPTLKPQDIRPYLALTEELQSRTRDGWKEVPLDALKTVVSKLDESAAKDELVAIVSRLAGQRDNVQRLLAVTPTTENQDIRGEEFRTMPIVPGKELVEQRAKPKIRVNRIGIQYSGVNHYLGTHFQLLREDCIRPLREGIQVYRSTHHNHHNNGKAKHSEASALQDLRIYVGVQLAGVRCGDQGVEFVLSFHLPAGEKTAEKWESSKKLMNGALLCISSNQFQTFFWGVVTRRDVKELAKGLLAIRIIGESDSDVAGALHNGQSSTEAYVMVESTASYFESYYHVLKTLQREEMENIPFTPYLLHLEPRVSPPSYLLRRKGGDEYDFSCAFPDIRKKLGRNSFRIMQREWPTGWADSLDGAQRDALKQGLTKELAIIQGPPGTGKTFLGLLLVKILLANLKRSPSSHDEVGRAGLRRPELQHEETCDLGGPILIICYTNHALDQFLEGIYRNGETDLIRIGGRGKSEILKNNTLHSLLLKQRLEQRLDGTHHRLFGRGRFDKDQLESKIHKCIDAMEVKLVTATMLEGIATWEQRQSLFWIDQPHNRSSRETVKLWLTEADPHLAQHFITINEEADDGDDDDESAAAAEYQPLGKQSRGMTKLLPKVQEPRQDGEWMEVRRDPRRGARGRRAEPPIDQMRLINPPDERPGNNGNGRRLHLADGGPRGADNVNFGPQNAEEIANGGAIEERVRLAPDVWQLTPPQRRKLHEYWLEEKRKLDGGKLRMLTEQYEDACRGLREVDNEIQLSLLRKAKIVGMTTTAAAKYHDVLKSLRPEIVIVEEAAEVLEGHILASISPSVEHLILIGDHLQLRPSVAVYDLAIKHKLDVSMFERLVSSGVEHVTLQEQRRMRPSISRLMRSLYPGSRDHESVARYEAVKGMKSNVFFFDHKTEEDSENGNTGSKVNSTEAELVVGLCLYLLNQGCYTAEHITILSMYTGQLQEIKRLLRPKILSRFSVKALGFPSQDPGGDSEEINLVPRVSSVDDYQGEESDIIILSLVRSNSIETEGGVGKIGFLSISNRINVALTRARKGMFIFGNADLLAEKSTLWNDVTSSMRLSGELGPQLEMLCQNHPKIITRITTADDFKQVEDGGCSLPCEFQLECGHACPRRCHPGSHDLIVCPKPCLRHYDECSHICNHRCHGSEDCPPCRVIVTKQMLDCEHKQGVECSKDIADEVCQSVCAKRLQCGHRCRTLCRRPCTELCDEKVVKMLPSCGHSARMPCYKDPSTHTCDKPCRAILPDCQHRCKGSCGECKRGTAHIPCRQKCGRSLPCGHLCKDGCSKSCPPCPKRCRKRCFHSRCSEVCGNLCKPCREPCSWQCEHHQCHKSCHEICTRPRCDLPCPQVIPECGHPCIGLCGEPCPKKCRVCHPETLDIITQMTLGEYEESDRFLELEDCGHVFEVSGLDTWMDSNETAQQGDGSVAIKLKECPECRSLIWRTHRYSNVVKKKHAQVEDVKRMMFGHELTRRGNLLLGQDDHVGALSVFLQALQQNPGLMEAHLGIGCALFAGGDYAKAVIHLSFVVERSSFASSLAKHIRSARTHATIGFLEKHYGGSSSRAGDSIAMQAIVQWASALTNSKEFTNAIELCDAVLGRNPDNRLAEEVKEKAKKGEVQLVVQAMAPDVGQKGHWYTCPNGHLYTIGECGGATQLSKCPDCKAEVGGGQHRLTAGNRHSNIDGSERSAWPGNP